MNVQGVSYDSGKSTDNKAVHHIVLARNIQSSITTSTWNMTMKGKGRGGGGGAYNSDH